MEKQRTPRPAPRLACVIFDLDGVLTDTAEYHYLAWKRLAEEQGWPFNRTVNEKLRGVSRAESLQIILRHARISLPAEERAVLADRKNSYYKALIATITPGDLLPEIPRLLDRLKTEGIRTAIASVSHNVWEVVRRLEIGSMIDLVVDPLTILKGKPDPEIFLRAAAELGVAVESCAGIEDAQAGVLAIKAAHMFAVGIGAGLQGADWLLPDTRGLSYEELRRRFIEQGPSGLQPAV